MFTSVQQAIEWITSRRRSEHQDSDYRDYLASLGNPQLRLKCLHVAGTNGKGSTTNYLRSILQQAGYKVGSFTSPHLMSHLDRIRINDENIDEQYFLDIVNRYRDQWEAHQLSMFEIDTIISFFYFLDRQVDYAVYEVGLGGRKDPTNVIEPLGAVITNIEMDHMEILGSTIAQIACEKAGIIKDSLTVVTFEKKRPAIRVFNEVCRQKNARLVRVPPARNVAVSDHIEFDLLSWHLRLPTTAPYQILNASAAVTLMRRMQREGKIAIHKKDIIEGLQTQWAGRFETVRRNPRVILDGAHNENGIDSLCQALSLMKEDKVIVFSALKDKEYGKMLKRLQGQGQLIVTCFANRRATTAADLASGLSGVRVIEDWNQALEEALASGRTVIVTGSLYFISLVREKLLSEK
ncbi:MAG: bifunctional folylpolyglutamate synthase/dihydrofolate synthase [Erysipelotrichaceae bacterium]|nr:bifunctional folylpolyglutamate synthase/dihydrofolate synthase [Erysipelotrichaceae bacterium]MBR5049409.1 bifunctional folylpolyglutamate synthase/dihydrofolate synthase [Erysipelotrichaceae bacterium]